MKLLISAFFICSTLALGEEILGPVKVPTQPAQPAQSTSQVQPNTTVICQKNCSDKPKPIKPKPIKPKPVKPKPIKPTPTPKTPEKECPTCDCPKQKKEKEIVYKSTYQPHSLSLLAGKGPNGFYPVLEKRTDADEYKAYRERGYFIGVHYEYQFAPNWAVGAGYLSNDTWFGSASYKWGQSY